MRQRVITIFTMPDTLINARYLLDTDFLIALHFANEATHKKAKRFAQRHLIDARSSYTNLVLQECATVISRKYTQQAAINFTTVLRQNSNGILFVDQRQMNTTWQLFDQQHQEKTSFIDCSNVVVARQLECRIVSLDKFYSQFSDVFTVL